jgi:hypothetical protein
MAWWPGDSFCVKQSSRVPNAFSANARHTSRGLLGCVGSPLRLLHSSWARMETVVMAERDRGNERYCVVKSPNGEGRERRGLAKGDTTREEGQISSHAVHMYEVLWTVFAFCWNARPPSLPPPRNWSIRICIVGLPRGEDTVYMYISRHAAAQRSTSSRSTSGAADLSSAPPGITRPHWPGTALATSSLGLVHVTFPQQGKSICPERQPEARMGWTVSVVRLSGGSPLGRTACRPREEWNALGRPARAWRAWLLLLSRRRLTPAKEADQQGFLEMR